MAKNSIMLDLDDPRSEKIADILANKTSKRILGLLADKEMSGSEIGERLGLPLNTVGYNLKNLVEAGLVEKAKRMFWSSRGKRMELYTVSNKRIIISPKSMIKGLIPSVLGLGVISLIVKYNTENSGAILLREKIRDGAADSLIATGGQAAESAVKTAAPSFASLPFDSANALISVPDYWAWFLLGGLSALLIFLLWNWKKF